MSRSVTRLHRLKHSSSVNCKVISIDLVIQFLKQKRKTCFFLTWIIVCFEAIYTMTIRHWIPSSPPCFSPLPTPMLLQMAFPIKLYHLDGHAWSRHLRCSDVQRQFLLTQEICMHPSPFMGISCFQPSWTMEQTIELLWSIGKDGSEILWYPMKEMGFKGLQLGVNFDSVESALR